MFWNGFWCGVAAAFGVSWLAAAAYVLLRRFGRVVEAS